MSSSYITPLIRGAKKVVTDDYNELKEIPQRYVSQYKALTKPEDDEAAAFKEKQGNVDQLINSRRPSMSAASAPPAKVNINPDDYAMPTQPINPAAQYGTRPGEQRIDTSQMTKPLSGMAPMYDDGGPVKNDPNDGHHQVAVLEEGERVLTPEQNKRYEKLIKVPTKAKIYDDGGTVQADDQQGAPADFPGRVLPNPDRIQVQQDTDAPALPYTLDKHARTDNAPVGAPPMDTSNPKAATIDGLENKANDAAASGDLIKLGAAKLGLRQLDNRIELPEAQLSPAMAGAPEEDKSKTKPSLINIPGATSEGVETPKSRIAVPPFNAENAKADMNKAEASSVGTIAPTGSLSSVVPSGSMLPMYNSATQQVERNGKPLTQEEKDALPLEARQAIIAQSQLENQDKQKVAVPKLIHDPTFRVEEALNPADYQAELRNYDDFINNPANSATPEGREEVARAKEEKEAYIKANPYGSAGNHPGKLGKIEHVLGEIGNIGGDILAPRVMPLIPGSQANRAEKVAQDKIDINQAEKEQQQNAVTQKDLADAAAKGPDKAFNAAKALGMVPAVNPLTGQIIPGQYVDKPKTAQQSLEGDKLDAERTVRNAEGVLSSPDKYSPEQVATAYGTIYSNRSPTERGNVLTEASAYFNAHPEAFPANSRIRLDLAEQQRTAEKIKNEGIHIGPPPVPAEYINGKNDPEYKKARAQWDAKYDKADKNTPEHIAAQASKDFNETIKLQGVQRTYQSDRDKYVEPLQGSIDNYDVQKAYVDGKVHTGAGDYSLMLQFQESLVAGQKAGIRFNTAEQARIENAQNYFNSLRAKVGHATGGTYFSNQQREDILNSMQMVRDKNLAKIDRWDREHPSPTAAGNSRSTTEVSVPSPDNYGHRATLPNGDKIYTNDKGKTWHNADGTPYKNPTSTR